MNWTAPSIFIHARNKACEPKARQLAELTGLPLSDSIDNSASGHWRLLVEDNLLQLERPDNLSISIDFINGKANRRTAESNFRKQPLARALGLHKLRAKYDDDDRAPRVVDATAGLGTDAWMMASLGCCVTLIEQSPVLNALLQHAIDAAKHNALSSDTAHQLNLIKANAIDYLQDDATARPDVIYLDPMYPATNKQALVKKGMQLLHELIGPDDNGHALLSAALNKANFRVVVKRPKGAPELGGSERLVNQPADQQAIQKTQIDSPNTRFDVYHIARTG